MPPVDDFLARLDAPTREAFARLVALTREEAPDLEQSTSYGLPALRHRGKPLVGFAAAASHLSLYPFSPAVVDRVRQQLEGYALSKGTIRFTVQHPLPEQVVRDVVQARLAEIDATLTG